MDYFNYPLDTKLLIRKKNKIKKELLEKNTKPINIRIAVLGGSTTNELIAQIEIFLLSHGIIAEFYESEFGQYWKDAMFGNDELDDFKPDIIYIYTNWRNIEKFPEINNSKQEVDNIIKIEYERFEVMWNKLFDRFCCPIIQNNFDRPNYRLLGNRDIWDFRGKSNFISRLNQKFYEYAQVKEYFYINDLEYISQDYGLADWNNSLYWNMYKYAMCIDAIPYVGQSVANIIKSIYGKNKKVLALDLDNTLWGGIIGDDGVDKIAIGPEFPKGEVFLEFQDYCKKLKEIGVVLTINSKNDVENALAGLSHPDGILRQEDFVDIKANWNSKDQNIIDIANELDLGVDSFVFVDDNPMERELVLSSINDVEVPEMDCPENYIKILDHSGYFEVTTLSSEDLNKTKQYRSKVEAEKNKSMFVNYDEYLESLEMKAFIREFDDIHIQRIAQLTNKTNQFNLTTMRCTETDIRHMKNDSNYLCMSCKLIDKFGDNGIVAIVVGEIVDNELHIRLWLMSCRVLKRELENVMMNSVVEEAQNRNIHRIVGYYYPTLKNKMVKTFYEDMGFDKISEDEKGNSQWNLDIERYVIKKSHIDRC